MRFLLLIWICCIACLSLSAQTRFRVMTYNVENLFDIHHDQHKNDYEFLPGGNKQWSRSRYHHKLQGIAKVIAAVGERQLPELVGLCEVENDSCLSDLIRRSALRSAGYNYVMTHSLDERGVDVALLYQPARFKPVAVQSIRVNLKPLGGKATRDILHVTGRLQQGQLLDVYMCHLPSRGGGQKASEPYRLLATQQLRHNVDSVLSVRPDARILIMGDFNDYPNNKSIQQLLSSTIPNGTLYNLMASVKPGTYRYRGRWNTLDQIIVNKPLQPARAQVFQAKWLLEKDKTYGGQKPLRTYQGSHYVGGYSDHLPAFVDLPLL